MYLLCFMCCLFNGEDTVTGTWCLGNCSRSVVMAPFNIVDLATLVFHIKGWFWKLDACFKIPLRTYLLCWLPKHLNCCDCIVVFLYNLECKTDLIFVLKSTLILLQICMSTCQFCLRMTELGHKVHISFNYFISPDTLLLWVGTYV